MSKLTNQWIELFRSGKAEGKPEFTDADLDQIAANYRPGQANFEEAPITIGHPSGSAPAWGWMESLKRVGSSLFGKPKTVQPEFESMVERGLFKKRSVGLVKRDNGWTLHHVAFLGAEAPAIKGLADCKFNQSGEVTQVNFEETSNMPEANAVDQKTFMEALSEFFAKRFPGTASVAATYTEADVKRIAKEAADAAVVAAVAPLQTQLDAQKATFSETQIAAQTAAAKAAAGTRAADAIAKLKREGKWVPAFERMGIAELFAELAKTTETVEFSESDTMKARKTPLEIMVAFMEGLKQIVPTAAVYTGQQVARTASASKVPHVNETRFAHADPNSVAFHEAIVARKNEKNIGYGEAMEQIAREKPELCVAGGAATGAV